MNQTKLKWGYIAVAGWICANAVHIFWNTVGAVIMPIIVCLVTFLIWGMHSSILQRREQKRIATQMAEYEALQDSQTIYNPKDAKLRYYTEEWVNQLPYLQNQKLMRNILGKVEYYESVGAFKMHLIAQKRSTNFNLLEGMIYLATTQQLPDGTLWYMLLVWDNEMELWRIKYTSDIKGAAHYPPMSEQIAQAKQVLLQE